MGPGPGRQESRRQGAEFRKRRIPFAFYAGLLALCVRKLVNSIPPLELALLQRKIDRLSDGV